MKPGHASNGTPEAAVHDGKGLVTEDRQGVRLLQIFRTQVLVEEMDVAEFQAGAVSFPQQVDAVVAAVEPQGLTAFVAVVLRGDDGCRRGQGVLFLEPAAGLCQGLDPDLSLCLEFDKVLCLGHESLCHRTPGEGILLPHLHVVESQMGFLREHIEEPVDPYWIAAAFEVDGLKGRNALDDSADSGFILVDRVASKHPENRDWYPSLHGLSGHVGVLAAWVVTAVPVATPKGVAVGSDLVAADAGSIDAVLVIEAGQGERIDEPGAYGLWIFPEYLLELFHVHIHQLLALLRSVADGEIDIRVPVPRIASSPGVSGGLDMRLGDLPPGPHLAAAGHLLLHQFLERSVDQGVVLKQIGALEVLAPQVLGLGDYGLEEHFLGDRVHPWFGVTHEVDDVYDPW